MVASPLRTRRSSALGRIAGRLPVLLPGGVLAHVAVAKLSQRTRGQVRGGAGQIGAINDDRRVFFREELWRQLGHTLDLASAGAITPVHLTLARIATAALILPILTGIRALFVPSGRKLHALCAWLALTLVVAAAVTGVVMVSLAQPLSPT